ncbi:GAF domain-containing protein, partial [bacterium]|nr:GAF domain-containing protein [bacterium]
KTELFRELFNELQKQIGVTWFHQAGKEGYEIPFKTIKTLLKNLEIYLDRLRESQQRRVKGFLKKRLKDDFGILKELIPKFSLFSEEQTPDSRYSVRNRTSNDYLDVVYDLFRRICRIEKRLIIFIDDFQHVEQSSVKLLFGLMERCRDLPILMVFSYTFEELSPEHRYHIDATINADYLEHLVLPPLNEAEVAGLTQWLFSNNLYEMPRLLEPLYYATQGNPSQLRTILQKLIDRGLIYFSDRSWHAKTEEVLKFIQDQRTITATLAPLMDWLPDEINVIKRSAVFLRCFTYGALNHLTAVKPAIEVSRNDLLRILDKAVQSNVLSVDKQKVYSYRDNNVRYALLSDLTTELRSDLHRAVARYLEKTELPDNPFSVRDIARHLDRSGDVKRAMEYYVKAAQLTDNGMFSDRQSEIYYNKALLCLKKLDENEVDVEVRFSVIYNAISHTFYYSREYDALWSEIQQLDSLIQGNKIRKMKSLSLRISLCHSMGHRKEMWQYGQELLDLGVDPEDEEYIVGSFFQLGSVVSDKSYTERIELIQRGIDIATRHKRYFLVIGSISVISILYSYLGRFREAEEITEKYLEVLKDSNLSDVRLMTVSWTRMLLELERGDFKKSLEYGKELESFQMIAGPSVVGLHQTCMATCYGMTGNFGVSLRLFDQLLRQSAKTEHLSEILTVYQGRMMLALRMKEPETALTYFEKAKSQLLLRPDPYLDTMFHILAGSAYMDLSQLEEASAVIIKAGTIARKIESPLLQFHLRFPQIRLDWLKTLNKKCIAEANQLLEEMFEMGVSGYYEVYRDNLDTWLKHPGKSSTSMSHLKTGEASILKLFEISQKMSTTHNLDEIFEAALEGAMQISGANQGYLFTCCAKEHCVHEDISIPTLVRDAQGRTIDEADYLFSPAILDAVLRSKEIIVARDARNESRWKNCKSVQKFGLRSILAAPIMFDNKIRGFIYLDNHHAASVFSMRDKETVGVFATQVAIALNEAEAFTKQEEVSAENAKLYEEIREHNRNLEKQVNLRTRELNEKTEQLQELNKHLEEKVNEELGRRIEQEQLLIQQSKMAAMGEMIGMIAHQWRQPLSSISTVSGNLQIFLDLDMINKDEFSTMLTTINDQVQFLSNTINDFRNFFSPKKKAESVQLGSIIERTLSLIGKSLESKSIVIKENHSFLEPIVTYSNEIMQVFVNILKNAQDAIVEKKIVSPRIIITGKETESHQIVTISDNAGGISEDHLEKIFEPYFSTKDEKTGTGLGLYMSKIIVEKHCHGELNVWNTNDGACFEMKLPIKNPGLEAEVS